ncbi:MAG: hypothetical protein ACLFR2_03555 [Candidatus Kapaibacterium sp.]
MKRYFYIIIITVLVYSVSNAYSCEIEFTEVNSKEYYRPGDELLIKIKVFLTHKGCPEGIKRTKFDGRGFDAVAGTKWRETSPDLWERTIKIRIKETKDGRAHIEAVRTCDKEGAKGRHEFTVKSEESL